MGKNLKWYQKPLRIVDFIPPDPERYAQLDMEKTYEHRRSLGFNAEHFEVNDVSMGDSGTSFFRNPSAPHQQRDLLSEALQNRGNLRMIAYFNVHWIGEALQQTHPDWMQHSADGKIMGNSYGAGGYACVNSPFREYAMGSIRALGRTEIDGIFLDGPFVFETGCWCDACCRKFRERFGYDAPRAPRLGTKEGEDWFLFKRESIASFMREAREILKQENPEAIIYMNNPQLTSNLLCSRDNRMTEPYQDMLLGEGGFFYDDMRKTPVWKPAATAMLLEGQANGKPCCVAIAGRHGPWSRYMLAEEEVRLAYWFSVAHGASTWYGIYNDLSDSPALRPVTEVNNFLENNIDCYTGTHSPAKIALLWSYATANHFRATSEMTDFTRENSQQDDGLRGDIKSSLDGWFDALSRAADVFDIIDETALVNGQLEKYDLLIMPSVGCLSDQAAQRVKAFVASGKNLIATYNTGFYDELGKRLEQPSLAEVFGIRRVEGLRANTSGDHILVPEDQPLFAGIRQMLIPSAKLGVECKATGSAQVIGCHRIRQRARYCELPEATQYPYILQNQYGKGICLYFTGNVDAFYDAYQIPECRTLLQNAVHRLTARRVTLVTPGGTDSVHISLREADDFSVLHLVNYTAFMTRPITSVVPLDQVQVTLHGWYKAHPNAGTIVRLLSAEKELHASRNGDDLCFTVPRLGDYEAAVLPHGE